MSETTRNRNGMRSIWVAALVLHAGCPGAEKPPNGDADADTDTDTDTDTDADSDVAAPDLPGLEQPGGCSDLVMYMAAPAGDLLLIFSHQEGLAQSAYESPVGTAALAVDLTSEGSLELWQGTELSFIPCNDALNGTEEIVTTWSATSGTAELEVVSDGTTQPWGEYPGEATLILTDVVLDADGAEQVTIASLSWAAFVGWLPG